MSSVTATAEKGKASKPRKKPERRLNYNRLVGALFIQEGKKPEAGYWLDPLAHQLDQGIRCFRLTKFVHQVKEGQSDHYDVRINPGKGDGECECVGHLMHGSKTLCRHIAALLVLHERGSL